MKKFLLIACFWFISSLLIFAQKADSDNFIDEYPKHIMPSSPEASMLAKYADISINHFTGTPNINIPFFTIKTMGYELPVSIQYHPHGIRVAETPTFVGLGWSLNAGGTITRVVKKIPDDYDFNPNHQYHEGNFTNSTPFENPEHESGDTFDFDTYKLKDGQPDIFYYNFAGHTGKFFFETKNSVHFEKMNNWKLDKSLDENGAIIEFSITLDDGIEYVFSEKEKTKTIQFGNSQPYYYSAWHLSKIRFPNASNDDFINFSYIEECVFDVSVGNKTYSKHKDRDKLEADGSLKYYIWHKRKKIEKIEWNVGYVEFNYDFERDDLLLADYDSFQIINTAKPKALSEINVFVQRGTWGKGMGLDFDFIKGFRFNYDYFNHVSTDYDFHLNGILEDEFNLTSFEFLKNRIKLNSVTQTDSETDEESLPPWRFTYNETPLPRRDSYEIDHWGFYNGNRANSFVPNLYYYKDGEYSLKYPSKLSLYPRQNQGNEIYYEWSADRNPNIEYIKSGVLKKITYPTGGNVSFKWEPHIFRFDGQNRKGGGLRIAELISDGLKDTEIMTTLYSYNSSNNNTKSSGKIVQLPIYSRYSSMGGIFEDDTDEDLNICQEELIGNLNSAYAEFQKEWNNCWYSHPDDESSFNVCIDPHKKEFYDNADLSYEYFIYCCNASEIMPCELPELPYFKEVPDYADDWGHTEPKKSYQGYVGRIYTTPQQGEISNGNHVGYEEVTIKKPGHGKTIYKYSFPVAYGENPDTFENFDVIYQRPSVHSTFTQDGMNVLYTSPYYIYPLPDVPNYGWNRGNLLEEMYSDKQGELLKRKEYNYKVLNYEKVYGITAKPNEVAQGGHHYYSYSKYYYLSAQQVLNSKKTTNYYNNNDSIVHKIIYEYIPNENTPWKYTNITNDRKYFKWILRTAAYNPNTSSNNFVGEMYSYNIFNKPVEIVKGFSDKNDENYYITDGYKNIYHRLSEQGIAGGLMLQRTNVLEATDPIPLNDFKFSNQRNSGTLPDEEQTINFQMDVFDDKYNTEPELRLNYKLKNKIKEKLNKTKPTIAYLWGYNYTYPIAKIENATYDEALSALNHSIDDLQTKDMDDLIDIFNDMRNDLPGAMITSFTYKPLIGMTSQTDPRGRTIYYNYDSFGRLEKIRDHDEKIIKNYEYHYVDVCSNESIEELNLNEANPPNGEIDIPYSHTFSATGGYGDITFSITSGILPSGITLNANTGEISGTPTETGCFTFTIEVLDLCNSTDAGQFVLVIEEEPLELNKNNPPAGTKNKFYSHTFTATGGIEPYNFTITGGSLPHGITLNTNTGRISGTPTETGGFAFTIEVSDLCNSTDAGQFVLVIESIQHSIFLRIMENNTFNSNAGSVIANNTTINSSGSISVDDGGSLSLEAIAAGGYQFKYYREMYSHNIISSESYFFISNINSDKSIDVVFEEEQIGTGDLYVYSTGTQQSWTLQTRSEYYCPEEGTFSFEFRFFDNFENEIVSESAEFGIYFGESYGDTPNLAYTVPYAGNWTLVTVTKDNSQHSLLTGLDGLYVNLSLR